MIMNIVYIVQSKKRCGQVGVALVIGNLSWEVGVGMPLNAIDI